MAQIPVLIDGVAEIIYAVDLGTVDGDSLLYYPTAYAESVLRGYKATALLAVGSKYRLQKYGDGTYRLKLK